MHFIKSLALVSSVLSGLVSATPVPASISKRQDGGSYLSSDGQAKLQSLGVITGKNTVGSGQQPVWIGNDGPYTMTFSNTSPNEVVLVVWIFDNFQGMFPASDQAQMTVSLAGNSANTITLSFADGTSGALAGLYQDTVLNQYGQIQNTWAEYTTSASGVWDISREVFAQGNPLSVVGPGGTTDMNTCVFECTDPSATTCGDAGTYQIINCAAGAQPGNQASPDGTSGGVGWNGAATASFTATFS